MSYDSFIELDKQRTQLRMAFLEATTGKQTDVKKLAKDTMSDLQRLILKELQENDLLSEETEKLFNDVTGLISTSASELGVEVLRKARQRLRKALFPPYPFDFPQPLTIKRAFLVYHDCLEYAITQDSIVREKWLMEGLRDTYKQNLKDVKEIKEQINRTRTQPQLKKID